MRLPSQVPTPADLQVTHPRLRADRLRAALRAADFDLAVAHQQFDAWLQLLHESDDPAFQVLLLELLAQIGDERLLPHLEQLRTHRADGVRLMSLRLLCDRQPARLAEFCAAHRRDSNLELRVLLATRLHASEPARSYELLLELLSQESGGLRERHALERVLGFLVEEAQARELVPRLQEMREDFVDSENYFGWALEKLAQSEK